MPLEINPDVKVTKDSSGIVRQLSHTHVYRSGTTEFALSASAPVLTPRALAEQYLREAAPVLGFSGRETANFSAAPDSNVTDVGVELRFKEEKSVGSAVTVAYDQTVFGLPIWNAGVAVRIDAQKFGVMGMHNAAHYGIDANRPQKNARFAPNMMHPENLCTLLGIPYSESLIINSTRTLVYLYEESERIDPQIESHLQQETVPEESQSLGGAQFSGIMQLGPPEFPSLPLPPVPDSIKNETHYVVTEVLFSYPFKEWGPLNWRVFIEPDTGIVLYLRALISCARGAVFSTDPVSATGTLHSASSPVNQLDAIRQTVSLFGLSPAAGAQDLSGEFVKLVNLEAPNTTIPRENPPHDFFYSSRTSDFAACSAYHHCDGFFRLLKGMGIDVNTYFNNTNFPVPVDPHALGNEVNAAAPSNSTGNGLGKLIFGSAQTGSGMGITADVRVVIHEFGHAVLWDHVDSPNFGFAHSPGDALAAILHDPTSKAPDRFETFPFMKQSAGLTRRHDRKVADGWGWFGRQWDSQYRGEQILSTTLFRVYQAAGGDSTDPREKQFASRYVSYLILKAVSLLSFTTRDPDIYVGALTEADNMTILFEGHPGGAFSKIFRWSFEQQGLYQAAPGPVTGPGQPPAVDVYIDDGRRGNYMPYPADFTRDSEIWNRHAPDATMQNQIPRAGIRNHAYAMVRNRGTRPAAGIVVKAFQSRTPQPAQWPTDWQPVQQPQIAVPGPLVPGGSVLVGPFEWVPQTAADDLLFSVSATGDRSNIESVTAGPILNRRLVTLDNNIAQRSFQ